MKKIFFILIMALTTSAFSQNIRFEGTVKDTTGVGLEMANIMAIKQQTKGKTAKNAQRKQLQESQLNHP